MEYDTEMKINDLLHAIAWMNLTTAMMNNMKLQNWQNDHLWRQRSISGQEQREGF